MPGSRGRRGIVAADGANVVYRPGQTRPLDLTPAPLSHVASWAQSWSWGISHDHSKPTGRKIHARLRHDTKHVLWVRDDTHWALMRGHRTELICPQDGCRVPIEPVDRKGTRYLRNKRGWPEPCDHWQEGTTDAEPGGGQMTKRHIWLRTRLVNICKSVNLEAIPEHPLTGADVYIPSAKYALEVQLRGTEFKSRTRARAIKDTKTVWLIPPDVNGKAATHALFRQPSVRLLVYDRFDRGTYSFEPWENPTALNYRALLEVGATTYMACEEPPYLRLRRMDCKNFLDEVLADQRVWVAANTAGMPLRKSGRGRVAGWVRPDDLDRARKLQAIEAETALMTARHSLVESAPAAVRPVEVVVRDSSSDSSDTQPESGPDVAPRHDENSTPATPVSRRSLWRRLLGLD